MTRARIGQTKVEHYSSGVWGDGRGCDPYLITYEHNSDGLGRGYDAISWEGPPPRARSTGRR